MKSIYTAVLGVLLLSCSVKESEKEIVIQHQKDTTSLTIKTQYSGTEPLFSKEDIKGVWTAGETENASFSIEDDSILFVDAYEYMKYEFRNDTLLYIEDGIPFFKTKIIKADKDSLVTSNEDGIRRLWRFKD